MYEIELVFKEDDALYTICTNCDDVILCISKYTDAYYPARLVSVFAILKGSEDESNSNRH